MWCFFYKLVFKHKWTDIVYKIQLVFYKRQNYTFPQCAKCVTFSFSFYPTVFLFFPLFCKLLLKYKTRCMCIPVFIAHKGNMFNSFAAERRYMHSKFITVNYKKQIYPKPLKKILLMQREADTHSVTSENHTDQRWSSINFIFCWIIKIITGLAMKFNYAVKGLRRFKIEAVFTKTEMGTFIFFKIVLLTCSTLVLRNFL